MPWRLQSEPTTVEKIIAGISYVTAGIAGFLYMLLTKENAHSTQFRFHVFQAMFLTIIMVLFRWGIGFLFDLLSPFAPLLAGGPGRVVGMILINGVDILTKAFGLLFVYGAIMAFLGKFAEVPYISNIVRHNMRV